MVDVLLQQGTGASASILSCAAGPATTAPLDKLAFTAERLVQKHGKIVEIIVTTDGQFDPIAGEQTAGHTVSYFQKAVPPMPAKEGYDGEADSRRDYKYETYLAAQASEFVPDEGQQLVIDCKQYTIVWVNRIYSGELIALYQLGLNA